MSAEAGRHMTPDEFRRWGREAVDWVADYLENVGERPVVSDVSPGDIRARLPVAAPETGESFDAIFSDLNEIILPGITHWQSPDFFAYFPSNASAPSMVGEIISAGLAVQGMIWETSPACTELETHVLDWMVSMLGLPERFLSTGDGGGVIQDTASSSTLCALLAARERATDLESNRHGLGQRRLVAYGSSETHSSLEKAVRIAGIGDANLRRIPVDESFAIRAEAFEAMVEEDIASGFAPFFCCATVGTTSSNAMDPVRSIGEITQRHGIWLHVDAAMSGTAALCPEFRFINDGVETADSYTFNPHKWMFTNFDCNAFWIADRTALIRALTIMPEYLENAGTRTGRVIDYRDWQIPLGRRFRALKLWFVIRHYGVEGLRRYVREHVAMAHEFAEEVRRHPDFALEIDPVLNLVCFRHVGGDDANQAILDHLRATGGAYLTHTRLNDRLVLRFCVGQIRTERHHVEAAWTAILAGSPSS